MDNSGISAALSELLHGCRSPEQPQKNATQQQVPDHSSLLDRVRAMGQNLKQDDQPTQERQGQKGEDQGQKQGQEGASAEKPAPARGEGESLTDFAQRQRQQGQAKGESEPFADFILRQRQQASGGNEGSSGEGGSGKTGTSQDGYERAQGRSLPDEQKQKDKSHDR